MKKEEPEEKPEPMEVEEKKPEIKTETKEEEEGGANGATSTSPSQSRRKSECDGGVNKYVLIVCDRSTPSVNKTAVNSPSLESTLRAS